MEIQNIRLDPSDNDGLVLGYTYHRPTKKNYESRYEDHKETFTTGEEEKAYARVVELHKMNIKAKRAKMKKMPKHNPHNKKGKEPVISMPMGHAYP